MLDVFSNPPTDEVYTAPLVEEGSVGESRRPGHGSLLVQSLLFIYSSQTREGFADNYPRRPVLRKAGTYSDRAPELNWTSMSLRTKYYSLFIDR